MVSRYSKTSHLVCCSSNENPITVSRPWREEPEVLLCICSRSWAGCWLSSKYEEGSFKMKELNDVQALELDECRELLTSPKRDPIQLAQCRSLSVALLYSLHELFLPSDRMKFRSVLRRRLFSKASVVSMARASGIDGSTSSYTHGCLTWATRHNDESCVSWTRDVALSAENEWRACVHPDAGVRDSTRFSIEASTRKRPL